MMPSNRSISFTFTQSTNSPDRMVDQLVARYKDKQLNSKLYKFGVETLKKDELTTIEPGQSIKLTNDHVWLKATHDREGNEATWIKINKNELISKLGIQEEELSSIQKANDLQALMSRKVKQALLKDDQVNLKGRDKIITNLIKSILCFFAVAPTAKDKIREQISQMDQTALSKELEDLYISGSKDLLDDIKKNLQKENPKALFFFGDEKISEIIDEVLIEEVNKKLKNDKKPGWNESKIQNLNILRDLDVFEKNNPDGIIGYTKLDQMNPKDIPLAKLAKIPVTDLNKMKLAEIFNKVLVDLHTQGKLSDLAPTKDERSLILQLDYARKFLEAYSLLPPEIRSELNTSQFDTLKQMEANNGIVKIRDFIIQPAPLRTEVSSSSQGLSLADLEAEQKIYEEKIRPTILDIISRAESKNSVANLIIIYLDLLNVENVGKKYKAERIWDTLDDREQEMFTIDRIEDLLCKEIESKLVVNYQLTSTQLNNIRDYKRKIIEEVNRFTTFTEGLKTCKNPEEIYNLLHSVENQAIEGTFPTLFSKDEISILDQFKLNNSLKMREMALGNITGMRIFSTANTERVRQIKEIEFKLANEINQIKTYKQKMRQQISRLKTENTQKGRTTFEIRQLLINTKIIEEISEGQKASFFTVEQQKGLMNFDFYFNDLKSRTSLWQVPDKAQMNEEEIEKHSKFLVELSKDPELIKVLESFKEKSNNDIQEILEKIPPSLHGLFKRMFSVKEETGVVNKIPAGISENTIDFLLEYVKKMQRIEKMERQLTITVEKGENLLKKFHDNPESITKDERLTLKELGLLEFSIITVKGRFSHNREFSFMSELKSLGLEESNPIITRFVQQSEKAQNILKELEKIVPNELDTHYQTGDILATNLNKEQVWKSRPHNISMRLRSFFSNGLGHGAKLYRDENNKIGVSEMEFDRETNILDLKDLLQSDIWRLNLIPLVPNVLQSELKELYGDKWEEKIQELYSNIENGIHLNQKKLSKLKNESERIDIAGLANYPTLATLLKGEKVEGHKTDYENDLTRIHRDFFENKDTAIEQDMICSEFVSKVTLASLIELNNQISEKLLKKFGDHFDNPQILRNNLGRLEIEGYKISNEVRDYANGIRYYGEEAKNTVKAEKEWRAVLKRLGYREREIEVIIRLGNKEILDLPYSKKERMEAIHPGRMVQLLVDRGCAIKMGLPPKLAQLFDVEVEDKK